MSAARRGPWADLVFHVLAHVRGSAHLAASLFDPVYVAFAARHLGQADGRLLGHDAVVLAAAAPDHGVLARAQQVAWLFVDLERADACVARDLAELGETDVDRPALLATLRQHAPAVELLRCAALIERPQWERLPPPVFDEQRLCRDIRGWAEVAPALSHCRLGFARALRLRGRVFEGEVWVGIPGSADGPSLEHVGWQAAHEATVLEVQSRARERQIRLDHAGLERASLVLLSERAGALARQSQHAAWYSIFGLGPETRTREGLDGSMARLIDDCLARRWLDVNRGPAPP